MAAEQNIPTFKLVLVGDGGTGKVIIPSPFIPIPLQATCVDGYRPLLSSDILRESLRRSISPRWVLKVSPLLVFVFWIYID
jgi:hypothetical protein